MDADGACSKLSEVRVDPYKTMAVDLQRPATACEYLPASPHLLRSYSFSTNSCALQDALVGYKHLQELKILKAAAARLCMQRDSSTSNAGAPFLLRSLSNIEVMPAAVQRLAGTSSSMGSSNTEQRGVPGLARLGRSNSAGSHKLSSYLPPPPGAYPLTSGQPSSTRGRSASASSGPSSPSAAAAAAAVVAALQTAVASSGTAAIDRAAAGQQHQHQQPQQLPWHRGPRHSEPASGGVGQDERVNLLLTEVCAGRQESVAHSLVLASWLAGQRLVCVHAGSIDEVFEHTAHTRLSHPNHPVAHSASSFHGPTILLTLICAVPVSSMGTLFALHTIHSG